MNNYLKIAGLLLVSCLIFAACQNTPEKSIVIPKDSTEQKVYDSANNKADVQFEYEVPEHITQKYVIKEGSLVIDIDADVYMPDIYSVPVGKITSDRFTQERADEIREYFIKDGILVTPQVWTKSDYDEWIVEAKKGHQENGEYVFDEGDEQWVEQLLQEREKAPDEDNMDVTTDFSINQENGLQGRIIRDQEVYGYMRITEREVYFTTNENCWPATETYEDNITREEHEMPQKEIDFTLEQANSSAQAFFADLGIENMSAVEWNKTYYGEGYSNGYEIDYGGYQIIYMREFGGLTPFPLGGFGMSYEDNYDYLPPAELEQILIYVNEYGVVTSFYWMNPIRIVETMTQHVDILPFNEVMTKLEEFLNIKYAYLDEREQSRLRIMDIYEIKLGLNYLPLINNPEEFMYAPCWFFVYKDCPQYTDAELAEYESIKWLFLDWEDKDDDFYILSAVDGASVSVYTQQAFDDMMENRPSPTEMPD